MCMTRTTSVSSNWSVVLAKILYGMRRPHSGTLRIHPTNNNLKHLCVAASISILSPRWFHCGSAWCRSGWWLVCCCFIERSAHSSFYFVTHRTVLGLGDTNLCWQPSVTLERHLFKEMYWYIVQLRSVNCFSKINVKWLTATVWRIREKIITAALLCAELCTTVIFFYPVLVFKVLWLSLKLG